MIAQFNDAHICAVLYILKPSILLPYSKDPFDYKKASMTSQ